MMTPSHVPVHWQPT